MRDINTDLTNANPNPNVTLTQEAIAAEPLFFFFFLELASYVYGSIILIFLNVGLFSFPWGSSFGCSPPPGQNVAMDGKEQQMEDVDKSPFREDQAFTRKVNLQFYIDNMWTYYRNCVSIIEIIIFLTVLLILLFWGYPCGGNQTNNLPILPRRSPITPPLLEITGRLVKPDQPGLRQGINTARMLMWERRRGKGREGKACEQNAGKSQSQRGRRKTTLNMKQIQQVERKKAKRNMDEQNRQRCVENNISNYMCNCLDFWWLHDRETNEWRINPSIPSTLSEDGWRWVEMSWWGDEEEERQEGMQGGLKRWRRRCSSPGSAQQSATLS